MTLLDLFLACGPLLPMLGFFWCCCEDENGCPPIMACGCDLVYQAIVIDGVTCYLLNPGGTGSGACQYLGLDTAGGGAVWVYAFVGATRWHRRSALGDVSGASFDLDSGSFGCVGDPPPVKSGVVITQLEECPPVVVCDPEITDDILKMFFTIEGEVYEVCLAPAGPGAWFGHLSAVHGSCGAIEFGFRLYCDLEADPPGYYLSITNETTSGVDVLPVETFDETTALPATASGLTNNLCGAGTAIVADIDACTGTSSPLAGCCDLDPATVCCLEELPIQGVLEYDGDPECEAPGSPTCAGVAGSLGVGTGDFDCGGTLLSTVLSDFDPSKAWLLGSVPFTGANPDVSAKDILLYCGTGGMSVAILNGNCLDTDISATLVDWDCETLSGLIAISPVNMDCCDGSPGTFQSTVNVNGYTP